MGPGELRELLEAVRSGALSVDDAVRKLREAPLAYLEAGEAKIDLDRRRRRGLPEVIYCEGKRPGQVREIFERLAAAGESVLGTRATPAHAEAVRSSLPGVRYDPVGRLLRWEPEGWSVPRLSPKIAVVSAGTADERVVREIEGTLDAFGHEAAVVTDVGVAGLQRLLAHLPEIREAAVAIVVAGWDAALPSVVAGLIDAPVIAVPTSTGYGASFGGLSALLAALNSCAGGVTVVNIDNGFGAAYAASLIVRKVVAHGAPGQRP